MTRRTLANAAFALCLTAVLCPALAQARSPAFFEDHCSRCHNAKLKKGGFDLASLDAEPTTPDTFARWLKVHDRIESGEMPPKKEPRPSADETATAKKWLAT